MNKLIRECIDNFDLDLSGLSVYTEAANGWYLYNAVLTALAGAEKVYAVAMDSEYSPGNAIRRMTEEAAEKWEVSSKIKVVSKSQKEIVSKCDIITNTGFVRPINREMISMFKTTAVVPLMWETWEFRKDDLDLEECKKRGILVLGTIESEPPLSIYNVTGFMAMKLLFELGIEGYKSKVILLGGRESPGRRIFRHFTNAGIETAWFTETETDSLQYSQLPEYFEQNGAKYDALIVTEHEYDRLLLGTNGLLSYETIELVNPALAIGIVSGNIDIEGLCKSNIHYFPENLRPFGYMNYQPYYLGPKPVVELFAAGLKVGEAMSRGRLSGLTPEKAAEFAMKHSLAMDFEADSAWIK